MAAPPTAAPAFGLYGTAVAGDFAETIAEIAGSGYQLAVVGATREQLDVLSAHGLKGVVGLGMTEAVLASDEAWEAYLAGLRSKIAALRDHPALYAWYVVDEPDGRRVSRSRLLEVRTEVRSLDPRTPLLTVLNTPRRWADYLDVFDIVAVDPYMRRKAGGGFEPPGVVTEWLEQLRGDLRKARLERRVWVVLGAFDLAPRRSSRPRAYLKPSREQLFEMAARARDAGVESVLIYSYAFAESGDWKAWRLRSDPVLWEAVKALPAVKK